MEKKQNANPRNFFSNFNKEWKGIHTGKYKEHNIFIIIGQIFTIIGAIIWCLTIIGLLWGLPMIMGCFQRLNATKKISLWHIVIAFVFYFFIGAVFTLVGYLTDRKARA